MTLYSYVDMLDIHLSIIIMDNRIDLDPRQKKKWCAVNWSTEYKIKS